MSQFFGIELADFAAETAKLSLWIAEYQMNEQFKVALSDLTSDKDSLSAQLVAIQDSVTSQDKVIVEAGETVSEKIEKIDEGLQSIEQRFSALSEKFENANTANIAAAEKVLNDSIKALERRGGEKISDLEKKRSEASAIVQSVGDILTTGTYRDTAEKEAKLANNYRWVTIGLFSIGILIVISNYILHAIALYNGKSFEETPWFLLSRFATAIAVALPAFYTARESARHRTNADRARQRELELKTLGPFIELLPAAKKNEIRDRLTDRYFSGETDAHEVHPPISLEQVTRLLESASKLAPKIGAGA